MKKLYLKPWDYNKAILLDMLDKYIVENGGELFGYYRPGTIIRSDHKGNDFGSAKSNHCDTFNSHSSFVLDGEYFYIEIDDNPFFDFHCQRIPLNANGKYVGTYFSDNLNKQWVLDCLFGHNITETEMTEVFEMFKDAVLSMKKSARYYDKEKHRVPNRYDGRYHYEWIDKSDKSEHSPRERKEVSY